MANGPRVFYCCLVFPAPQRDWVKSWLAYEAEISARGPKSAAEIYIGSEYPEALRYKPGIVQVRVQEQGGKNSQVFSIATTVTARPVRSKP